MNIALFPSAFHPSLGGVEELTRQLALELKRQGHGVLILTERWPRDLPARETIDGLNVRRFPMRVPTGHWKANLSFMLTHRSIRSAIVAELRRFNADVLHVQCVSSTTLYAMHAKEVLGLPLVVSLQGELSMDAAGIFQRPGIAQDIMRKALERADAITGCSQHTLEEAESFYGHSFGTRGKVIFNGVRENEFESISPYQHARPYILAIGRLVHQKGFDVLLRAYAVALAEGCNHDLIIAGDGREQSALKTLINSLKLAGRAHLIGRADRPKSAALFNGCSFFVLPSRHEPFGIVNLEAMAASKAVIATRVGGVPEVVRDNIEGMAVEKEDIPALARAIKLLASDAGLRQALGRAGRIRSGEFSWQEISRRYGGVYSEVIHRNTGLRSASSEVRGRKSTLAGRPLRESA